MLSLCRYNRYSFTPVVSNNVIIHSSNGIVSLNGLGWNAMTQSSAVILNFPLITGVAASLVEPVQPMRLLLQPGGLTIVCNRPEMVLGRHSTADIRLPTPDVSRHHCRLQHTTKGWRVVDLSSLNGIFVNDRQVPDTILRPHDRLRVGGFTFEVELPLDYLLTLSPGENRSTESAMLRSIADSLPTPSPNLRKAS